MIKAGSITKGIYLKWHDEPVLVADKEFYSPGKGSAIVRLKLKNLKNGNVLHEVIKTDEMIEETAVDYLMAQYLYKDENRFVFMDPRSYEQYQVAEKLVEDSQGLIKEGLEYQLVIYENEVIGINFPTKMSFKVIEAEVSDKGNTVTAATKSAKLETGIVVKVPLFIREGDVITIDTETKGYVGRKN
ncbi:MAG TPA: elongation factor P [Candidatus Bathyarchaeia archaeon]|nr:elongation factor P [Candidatus Bathyarchaeia archaeon]